MTRREIAMKLANACNSMHGRWRVGGMFRDKDGKQCVLGHMFDISDYAGVDAAYAAAAYAYAYAAVYAAAAYAANDYSLPIHGYGLAGVNDSSYDSFSAADKLDLVASAMLSDCEIEE